MFDGPPHELTDAICWTSTVAKGGWNERRRAALALPPHRIPAELAGADRLEPACAVCRLCLERHRHQLGRALSSAWATAAISSRGCFRRMFALDKLSLLYTGMVESLQIAIIATVGGVLISLPLGLAAARNLAPAAARLDRARADRAVPQLSSGHRRDPVRQGGRFRRSRRHAGADRCLAGLPVEAGRRGGGGNVDEASGGGARHRLAVSLGRGHEPCCRR